MRILRRSLLWAIITLLFSAGFVTSAQARPDRTQLEQAIRATVLVLTLDDNMEVVATGSGSVVDSRGLILTNFHVVGDPDSERLNNRDGVVGIAMTRNLRQAAVPLFLARVIRSDPQLDLALLRVVADVEGNNLKDCLNLPAYAIGDSEQLLPGDDLTTIGFPGIGGSSYTVTSGKVSGFENNRSGQVVWIKTDAEISPGNSGGSAVADDGTLVGVPSAGRVREDATGKLGLVRPMELAKEVLQDLNAIEVAGCRAGSAPAGSGSQPGGPSGPGSGSGSTSGSQQRKSAEVTLTGRAVSADSGRPVARAIFVILKPGVQWADITRRNLEANIYETVRADSKGVFQTSKPINLDTAYSVGLVAEGFADLLEDEVTFRELYESGNVLDLGDIGMKRR